MPHRWAIVTTLLFLVIALTLSGERAATLDVVSINSTSQGRPGGAVATLPIAPFSADSRYRIIAANDLGMHCGDLDDRIATILPPFNVIHAQVFQRAPRPIILDSAAVNVTYSSSSQIADPALANPPITAPDGGIFKTNFWNTAVSTYAPFYPPDVLAMFLSKSLPHRGADVGLPVPNLERLYLGDGQVELTQQTMPSVTRFDTDPGTGAPTSVRTQAYSANKPQPFKTFETNWPLFINFPFGYVASGVKWFAAEGVPMAPFDDNGRENPYPLLRIQAKLRSGGKPVATLDTVVPVAGEADCKNCHLPPPSGNGLATGRISNPMKPGKDPKRQQVPLWVSEEWAADVNILLAHDLMHSTQLFKGFDATSGVGKNPVACQTCHYTPALDLLHLGPQDAHGLTQGGHETMSRVMHNGHGRLKAAGAQVFPTMPPPTDPRRTKDQDTTPINAFEQKRLEESCYQCHPGKRTQCLRGTMTKAGAVCQDCHGQMTQVGNDFSRKKPGGDFIVAADFYTNPDTPRVPWANEPTCGSCHTGDANSNLAARPGTIAAADEIRLLQAYLSTDDKATPILPTNMRFAEPRVTNGPAAGNPQLFRLSVDKHGGVFCEGCHGSTHAEFPTNNPSGNDNVTATQLQGHVGPIMECNTCHTGTLAATLDGPHGMHPVGNDGNSAAWVSRHGDFVERRGLTECAACHGTRGQGTLLGRTATARGGLRCDGGLLCNGEGKVTLPAGMLVSCGLCHANPFRGGGGGIATTKPQ